MRTTMQRALRLRVQLPPGWQVLALLALTISYTNGFWVTALQGAVGSAERSEPPFLRWLRDATLMLPLVALSLLAAQSLARRAVRRVRQPLASAAAIVVCFTLSASAAGALEVAANSALDYRLQVQHHELRHSFSATARAADQLGFGSAAPLAYSLYCNLRGLPTVSARALVEYATFSAHVRALTLSSTLLLATNLPIAAAALWLAGRRPLLGEPAIERATD